MIFDFPDSFGADGGTRTLKPEGTRPSNVRVYQFRHIRMENAATLYLSSVLLARICLSGNFVLAGSGEERCLRVFMSEANTSLLRADELA